MADITVSASVEQIMNYTSYKCSLVFNSINIQPVWFMDE